MADSNISVEQHGDVVVVRPMQAKVTGRDGEDPVLERLLDLVDADERSKFVLDLSRVQFLGSSALNQLVVLDRRVKEKGGQWKICSPRREICEVFNITRLDSVFSIADTEEAALEMLRA